MVEDAPSLGGKTLSKTYTRSNPPFRSLGGVDAREFQRTLSPSYFPPVYASTGPHSTLIRSEVGEASSASNARYPLALNSRGRSDDDDGDDDGDADDAIDVGRDRNAHAGDTETRVDARDNMASCEVKGNAW